MTTPPAKKAQMHKAALAAQMRREALTTLGLKEGAADTDVRSARRRLLKECHPDRNPSDGLRAAQINAAADYLLKAPSAHDVRLQIAPAEPQISWGRPAHALLTDALRMIRQRSVLTNDHKYVASALWTIHTYVYKQPVFGITPRLGITSPRPKWGKSALLDCLTGMVESPLSGKPSAPAIYHRLAAGDAVFMIDEVNKPPSGLMRDVINMGYVAGKTISRVGKHGEDIQYPTHAPVALAGINLARSLADDTRTRTIMIDTFKGNPAKIYTDWFTLYQSEEFLKWRTDVKLWAMSWKPPNKEDVQLPKAITDGRDRDNWRGLIAIADAMGYGDEARAAAIWFVQREPAEALDGAEAIKDIHALYADPNRGVWQNRPRPNARRDHIWGQHLVVELLKLDDQTKWWRGNRPFGEVDPIVRTI